MILGVGVDFVGEGGAAFHSQLFRPGCVAVKAATRPTERSVTRAPVAVCTQPLRLLPSPASVHLLLHSPVSSDF